MTRVYDYGVSDTLGAILLVAIVATAVTIVAAAVLSQPVPEHAPALSSDISVSKNTITLRHNGGDSVARDQLKILVDNQDLTNQFIMTGAGTGWSAFSIGDALTYTGSAEPGSVQLIYNSGSASRLLQSWGVAASGYTPVQTTPIIPTPTATPVPAPVADFSGTPVSGSSSLSVSFEDLSTNNPTSWLWDFGDGGSSGLQNLSYTYANPGIFSVSLTASNAGGSDTRIRSDYITVNPVISATAGTGGLITPNGSVVVPYGTSQTFAIMKNTGYSISSVIVDGTNVGAVPTYTFPSVTTDHTIQAVFSPNPLTQIYYEGFESGTGGWAFTGDNSRVSGSVPKNQTWDIQLRNTGTMTRTIPTTGYSGIVVQFGWCAQSLDSTSEYVRAEYSTDGGSSWTSIAQITGPTGSPTTLTIVTSPSLSAGANNILNFRLRFRIQGNSSNDRLYVDDVKVMGIAN